MPKIVEPAVQQSENPTVVQQPEGSATAEDEPTLPTDQILPSDDGLVMTDPYYSDDLGMSFLSFIPTVSGDVTSLYHGLDEHASIEGLDEEYLDYANPIISAVKATGDFDSVEAFFDLEHKRYIYATTDDNSEVFANYCHIDGYQTASYQSTIMLGKTGDSSIMNYDLRDTVAKIANYTGISVSEAELREMMSMCIEHINEDNYYNVSVEDTNSGDMLSVGVTDYRQNLECWHISANHLVQSYPSLD